MKLGQLKQQAVEPLLLVGDATAALRWEAVWLEGGGAQQRVAARPQIATAATALARIHERRSPKNTGSPPLTGLQTAAVWRRVVAESRYSSQLITAHAPAAAAGEAWRRLNEWDVPWKSLRAPADDPDFAALLDWCHAYERLLEAEGWLDAGLLCGELARAATAQPVFTIGTAVAAELPPAVAKGLRLGAAGGELHAIELPKATSAVRFRSLSDAAGELQAAGAWIGEMLDRGSAGPFAVVMSDAATRVAEIESVLGDVCAGAAHEPVPLWLAAGRRLTDFGAPGAATNALELIAGQGRFAQLGAWLRSPFFEADDPPETYARCQAEAELRAELVTQWRFADAMRRAGLSAQLARRVPATARRLTAALEVVDAAPPVRLATEWIACFEAILRALGWQPTVLGTTRETLGAWDRALQGFASISPILGRIDASRALEEFRRIADRGEIRGPMPLKGVHVFERPVQVGPGYAGIWLCGFTDRQWPQPMRLAPLLPGRLQRAHGMPEATPEGAHRKSLDELEALLRCGGDIVLSAPAEVDDAPAGPSRLLGELPVASSSDTRGAGGYARRRMGTRARSPRPDPVPAAAPGEFAGGMRLLELQALCPARAFCELRLGARPLERIRRGIHPRIRGIALHRALELLFRPAVGHGPLETATLRSGVGAAVKRALRASIPWQEPPWDLIAALEAARAERALLALLDQEATRAAVEIADVEAKARLEISGHALDGRIDRIDRLPDGRVVIVDYKTGQAPTAAGWFGDRLTAPQLPAYAVAGAPDVAAFVVAAVADDKVNYRATGDLPADHPARAKPELTGADWHEQVEIWRSQIAALLDEFAAGDVRIDADATQLAGGEYAPLTRLHGQGDSVEDEADD